MQTVKLRRCLKGHRLLFFYHWKMCLFCTPARSHVRTCRVSTAWICPPVVTHQPYSFLCGFTCVSECVRAGDTERNSGSGSKTSRALSVRGPPARVLPSLARALLFFGPSLRSRRMLSASSFSHRAPLSPQTHTECRQAHTVHVGKNGPSLD